MGGSRVALLNFLNHSVLEQEAELAVNKQRALLVALVVSWVCACGQAAATPPVPTPSITQVAVTLESISSQPADFPSVGLQKCTTGPFSSGDLSTTNVGITDEWKTVHGAGAVEGWVQKLTLACPGVAAKPRVRNDVIRFGDAAGAAAYFGWEKKNSRSTAIFWPIGGTATAGTPTGLGTNSISMVFMDGAVCALWSSGAFLVSYCSVHFASADGLKGALAVNARIPKP
jgi:hypothetical protein